MKHSTLYCQNNSEFGSSSMNHHSLVTFDQHRRHRRLPPRPQSTRSTLFCLLSLFLLSPQFPLNITVARQMMTPDSSRDHKPLKYIPPVFIFVSPSLVFNTQILILNSFTVFTFSAYQFRVPVSRR